MVAELVRPTPDGPTLLERFSAIRTIPDHLQRRTLKTRRKTEGKIPEALWSERGRAVEVYVQDVIATQTDIVDRVEINEAVDAEGPDLTIYFVKGYPIVKLKAEIKSSTHELRIGKRKIRDEIFTEESDGQLIGPWTLEMASREWNNKTNAEKELAISQRLTEKEVVLINGGEKDRKEKTPEEILYDSFYPQLERRLARVRELEDEGKPSSETCQTRLVTTEPTQIFPTLELTA
jgi:hypothetical protein